MQLTSFIIACTLVSVPRVEVHLLDETDSQLKRIEVYLVNGKVNKRIRSMLLKSKDFSTSVNATYNEYLISNLAIAVSYKWKRFATLELNEVVGIDSQRAKQRLRVLLRTWDYSGRIISDSWVAVPLNNEPAFLGIDDRGHACIVYRNGRGFSVAARIANPEEQRSIPSTFSSRLTMSVSFGAEGGSVVPFGLDSDGYTAEWPDIRLHQLVFPGGKINEFGGSLEKQTLYHFDNDFFTGQWGTKRATMRWGSNKFPAYVYLLGYPYFIGSVQSSSPQKNHEIADFGFDSISHRSTFIYNIESGSRQEIGNAWLTVPLK